MLSTSVTATVERETEGKLRLEASVGDPWKDEVPPISLPSRTFLLLVFAAVPLAAPNEGKVPVVALVGVELKLRSRLLLLPS